ncbi:MAG: hypothetical protein IIY94_04545 [Oscillospiraceae bacterium]|nr:hypothetical protein [Oscillospiraceae bacterium]
MTYEKLTGAVNLEELEVRADEVSEVSAASPVSAVFTILCRACDGQY